MCRLREPSFVAAEIQLPAKVPMKMTIGTKLFAEFGASLTIALVMGCAAIYNVGSLGNQIEAIGHHYAPNLHKTGEIQALCYKMLAASRGTLLWAHMNDVNGARVYEEQFTQSADALRKDAESLAGSTTSAAIREHIETKMLPWLVTVLETQAQTNASIARNDLVSADANQREKQVPNMKVITAAGDKLNEMEEQKVISVSNAAAAIVAPARYLSISLALLSFGVGIVGFALVRSINATLRGSIAELQDGAAQVANSATQVSAASQTLAQGASEQAASLQDTSASSEEINAMALRNTDNSRSTARLLEESQEKIALANRNLEDMVSSMNAIEESSGKISRIIKVIDDIAFQTNILALNAAVEAARAGEAGMGFAVVADEVRNLAQRSAAAAKDTATLIEESIGKSSEGKQRVEKVAAAIRAVTDDSTRIKGMVDEVSRGSQEQSRGIDQIRGAIGQMEQVTQTTAASAEESAASAEEMSAQSQTLQDVVDRLHAMVDAEPVGGQRVATRSRKRAVRQEPAFGM